MQDLGEVNLNILALFASFAVLRSFYFQQGQLGDYLRLSSGRVLAR